MNASGRDDMNMKIKGVQKLMGATKIIEVANSVELNVIRVMVLLVMETWGGGYIAQILSAIKLNLIYKILGFPLI